jgi:Periplasmic copper-binding protein (NosD)
MHRMRTLVAMTVVATLAGLVAPAQAQVKGARPTPAPTPGIGLADIPFIPITQAGVITQPGSYRLVTNISSGDGAGIVIQADEVTLDLAGHSITGPGQLQGMGVVVDGAKNVEVTNGHLQDLGLGVFVNGGRNVVVSHLQIDGQDLGGTPPDVEIGVMLIDTRGARIVDNQITQTFLGIFVRGEASGGNLVADNVVTGGDNGELAICYNPAPGGAGGPDGDLVTGNVVSHFRRGLSLSDGSAGNIVRDNTIAYFDLSIQEATGGANLIEDNHLQQIVR